MTRNMSSDERPEIGEVVVVEGIHDKQAVDLAVKAEVWVIGGDRVAGAFLRSLQRASQTRGVIVLTDPDGPGERIRRRIDDAVPGCRHAHVQRSAAVSKKGLGVEHAAPEVIAQAIVQARRSADGMPTGGLITFSDLVEAGLVGMPNSAVRRAEVGETLRIGYGNARAFLRKLNALGITREEWAVAINTGKKGPDSL